VFRQTSGYIYSYLSEQIVGRIKIVSSKIELDNKNIDQLVLQNKAIEKELVYKSLEIIDSKLIESLIKEEKTLHFENYFKALFPNASDEQLSFAFSFLCKSLDKQRTLGTALCNVKELDISTLMPQMFDTLKTKSESKTNECMEQMLKSIFWYLSKHIGQPCLSQEIQICFNLISDHVSKQIPLPPPLVYEPQTKSEEHNQENIMKKKSEYLKNIRKAQTNKIEVKGIYSMNSTIEELKNESERVSQEMAKMEKVETSLFDALRSKLAEKFPQVQSST